jgi:CheY-like chemotaxis protein/two-component sensor histidine kinase
VLALYSEIDEKNQRLRQAYELKSQFLSNMSHELRTPINSVLALSRLLLEKADGPLTVEQEKQMIFIGKATQDLSELVNDLLDLAKLAAGKVTVRPGEFEATNLFAALRGLFRPLETNPSVNLIFEEPRDLPLLYTDEGKTSQILRNFISNALKFTEQGEVRVSAVLAPDGEAAVFSVADTGIGITPEDQAYIFEEFSQIENPMQRHVKGTGLGLALSKGLAEMLGGEISLKSEPGVGSTFSAVIPVMYSEPHETTVIHETPLRADTVLSPVLVIENDPATLLLYDKYLKGFDFQVIPAHNLDEAKQVLKRIRPAAIVLDILLPGGNGWGFLAEMKGQESTQDIPIIVATILDEEEKGMALGADDYCVKPVDRKLLLNKLKFLAKDRTVKKILVIDDREVDRYLIKTYLARMPYKIIEAANGVEGLQKAVTERPDVILLDLVMPKMDGFEVLERLKSNPDVCDIPVIIITSKALDEEEKRQLAAGSLAILSKSVISSEEVLRRIKDALIKTKTGASRA